MLFSLLQPLSDIPLAFIDTETTGASAALGHRVVEVGIVRIEKGVVAARYQQLIDPCRHIGPGISALTGITHAMVRGQPRFDQQLDAMLPLLRGALVVGHNIRFDLSFLNTELKRCGLDMVAALDDAPVGDTLRIARRRFGRGGNGLQRLAQRLEVVPSGAHRALADAETTAKVFARLLEPVGGFACRLCDLLREQGGPMRLLPESARQSLLPLELEEALELGRPVVMEYVDASDRRTERVIQPMHVRRQGEELVLVAHCQLRGARRTFKLERIIRLTRCTPG